jgi:hypothetical protein
MYSIQNLIQLENYNGVPLAGGKIYVYHQGRTELATIYSDYNGATPIANPATLDALGMQEIYVSQRFNYTVVVTDPYGNELFSRDIHTPINSISGSGLPYEGIYPINVDNTAYSISADTIPFGIQEPLYFVKDDAEGMIIGMSGEYIPQSASGQFVPTSMMDLYASKNWVNEQGFITGIPESATWNTVTGKVDTTAFDNYSAEVSGQIDYVSANAGTTYSAGANIDITNDVISGKDWTDSITGASAYAYNEATAQIPTDYATLEDIESAVSGKSDKFTVLTYNQSTWTDFITALNKNTIVLCKYNNIYAVLTYYNPDTGNRLARFTHYQHVKATYPHNPRYYRSYRDYAYIFELSGSSRWTMKEGYVSTMMLAGDGISESYNSENDRLTFSINPEQVASAVSGLLPSMDLSYISGQVDNKLDKVDSANFYPMTGNPSGFLTGETDWTNTITAASAYAYSEATAAIPTDYATTAQLADKLDSAIYAADSGNFLTALPSDLATTGDIADLAQSISETYQPLGDYALNSSLSSKLDQSALELTGEYVSGVNLSGTSYRLYAGWSTEASIAQTANFDSEGNYIVEYVNAIKTNSGDWNNVSAKLDSTAFSTVSGDFLTAHQSLTASANWDSTYNTVSDNSASWAGGAGGDVYTSGFEYTTGGNISAYSGSAFVGNEPTFNLVQGYGISMTTANDSLTIANTLVLETGSI